MGKSMSTFSAHERVTKMQQILRRENGQLAAFVIELAEFDRLEMHLDLGYRSLWDFCRRELGLSEKATYYRIAAARALQSDCTPNRFATDDSASPRSQCTRRS